MLRFLSVGALIILLVVYAPIPEWIKDLRFSGTPKGLAKCLEENDQDFLRSEEVQRACLQRHARLNKKLRIDQTSGMSFAATEIRETVVNVEVTNETNDEVLVGVEGVVLLRNPVAKAPERLNSHSFDFLALDPIYPSKAGEFKLTLDGFKVGEVPNCNDDDALAGKCWSWSLDVKYYSLPILSNKF